MTRKEQIAITAEKFKQWFGTPHTLAAYAPGRVEVLGNHTDYNEGYVLSAAIDRGTCFMIAPSGDSRCRLVAGDLMQEVSFDMHAPKKDSDNTWANYVIGVFAGLYPHRVKHQDQGWNALFFSTIPLGAGLSSSAALEMGAALALSALYAIELPWLDLARIGQTAEHTYTGVRCGLLDQITSLSGKQNHLVKTDFRTLDVNAVPLGGDFCFLVMATDARHALVDGAYNERRQSCETAAEVFQQLLPHDVKALRDVSMDEWNEHRAALPELAARRAAHVIGENERVLAGSEALQRGDVQHFGFLMFESHHSSMVHFENSCAELDFLVEKARNLNGVMGARLSGGGFGGSAVLLVHPDKVDDVIAALNEPYKQTFGHECAAHRILPSEGACLLGPAPDAASQATTCVNVDLGDRSYDIRLGHGFEASLDIKGDGNTALVISDENVDALYGALLQESLEKKGFQCHRTVIPAGEASKSLEQAGKLYDAAWQHRLDRKSTLVALGGGVPGDLAGFVAATYLRGLPFLQVPTSLLAMVDSSVGGKTAINLAGGKNLVGAFYQPRQVAINIDTLQSLPEREYRSGLAEVIKYGVIRDRDFFDWLEANVDPLKAREDAFLQKVIARCCEIKAEVVKVDERESGLRAILNYGHTLGHALETVAGYGSLLHGEAVALGMVFAGEVSCRECKFPREEAQRVRDLLECVGLPVQRKAIPTPPSWNQLREVMASDKKAVRAVPTFVLAERIGFVREGFHVEESILQNIYEQLP